MRTTLRSTISILLGASVFALVAAAQTGPTVTRADTTGAANGKASRFSSKFDVGSQYDGNVFLLAPSKKGNLVAPSAGEIVSGRYANMRNAADLVTTLVATFDLTGKGISGRDLTLEPSVVYEWYGRNPERSNATLELSIEQLLRHEGRIRLRGTLQPSYFARNYLADAIDGNVNGTISAAERVYARGNYSESSAQVDYRRRLAKSTPSRAFGAWLLVGGGLSKRAYDAPFAARDISGPIGSVRLQLDLAHGIVLQTRYDIAMLDGSRSPQILILDEPLFGLDLNGNGVATDLSARTVQTIDRSRTEHGIAETATFALAKHTDLELSVDLRWRSFSSTEPFDAANNGRRDRRGQYGVELTHRLARSIHMYVGGQFASQKLNRPPDLGGLGEVDDFTKVQAHLGFRIAP